MRIQVRLFATLARHGPGVNSGTPFEIDLPDGSDISDLMHLLKVPDQEMKVAFVNGRIRPLDWKLEAGDEVGIFPPIGGG